jgi:hypothetical protein
MPSESAYEYAVAAIDVGNQSMTDIDGTTIDEFEYVAK